MTSSPTPALLAGIDFSCNPNQRKPVTLALGHLGGLVLKLQRLENFSTLDAFSAWLATSGPWLAAFDFRSVCHVPSSKRTGSVKRAKN